MITHYEIFDKINGDYDEYNLYGFKTQEHYDEIIKYLNYSGLGFIGKYNAFKEYGKELQLLVDLDTGLWTNQPKETSWKRLFLNVNDLIFKKGTYIKSSKDDFKS